MKEDDSVPLHRDFLAFFQVFTLRAVSYGWFFFNLVKTINTAVFCRLNQVKDMVLAILMRRRGFFTPIPRFGLTSLALISTFSSFFVLGTSNFQTKLALTEILAQNGIDNLQVQTGEVLSLTNTAPITPEVEVRNEVIEYDIKPGDTLSLIGERYLVSVDALSYINQIQNEDLLTPGERIKIPPTNGLIHTVKQGENISFLAQKYEVSPQAIVDMNYLIEPFLLSIGQELVIPDAKIPQEPAPQPVYLADGGGLSLQSLPAQVGLPAAGTGSFSWPTAGMISQYFSWYHPAIDIANRGCGGAVVAADGGKIYFAGWWAGGGGNTIMIDHENGFFTKYAHLGSFARSSGHVQKGEVIGYVGASGRAFGCHLHFVVEKDGRAINPLSVL